MTTTELNAAKSAAAEALKAADAAHTLAKAELSKASSAYKKSGKAAEQAMRNAYELSLVVPTKG